MFTQIGMGIGFIILGLFYKLRPHKMISDKIGLSTLC